MGTHWGPAGHEHCDAIILGKQSDRLRYKLGDRYKSAPVIDVMRAHEMPRTCNLHRMPSSAVRS